MTTPSRSRTVAYWVTTAFVALAFLTGGVGYLARMEAPVKGIVELGYPIHFVLYLGFWKLLGGLALLAPRLPRVKEWAYAGVGFDLLGAAWAHAAVGDPAWRIAVPVVFLALTAASWALRPPERMLAAPVATPSPAPSHRPPPSRRPVETT